MNALPWPLLPITATVLLLGCVTGPAVEPVPIRTVAKGAFSAVNEPRQELIKSQKEWEALWPKLSTRLKEPALPSVNFEQEMLIFVAMGQQRTGGYALEISKVERSGDKLKIYVNRREPPREGFTLQVITAPFHVVAVPRADLQPEFIQVPPPPR